MYWYLAGLVVFLVGALLSLAGARHARLVCLLGPITAMVGGGLVLVEAIGVLVRGEAQWVYLTWQVPLGSANLQMDALSAVFAVPIVLVTALAALFGSSYLQAFAGRKNLGASWFFYHVLTASMLLVVVARNGVLFLVSWEMMSLASFFLVIFENERESVCRAGWTYLVAMHLGTALLIAMFLLLGQGASTLDFEQLSAPPGLAGLVFVLAVIGFGTKAGFVPMHVWLPEAHPAAPSHVSAVMSAVMIKTGIYGLLRIVTLLDAPPAWWGWTLVVLGVVSGILGVLMALAQHDLKRLLAYHSVENIGIIAMGLGVGILGVSCGNPAMAAFGLAGGLLHVLNHAVFKSLLFLGAGAVLHATGTREIDRLGGLLKRMPMTGATFLVGAVAISGLPPLNGFVSELLVYLGAGVAICGAASTDMAVGPWLSVLVIGGLALIGGLAVACFTKAFGIVFLGEPRSPEARDAHEASASMRWPMVILAGLCLVIGLAAPLCPLALRPAVGVLVPASMHEEVAAAASQGATVLLGVSFGSYILLGFVVLLAQIRRKLLAGREVGVAVTWDCGYVTATPRMQYTASSFAQPLMILFRALLRPKKEMHAVEGLFPPRAALHTHTPDALRQGVYEPLFRVVGHLASQFRWLQQGRLQLYVLYIALTLLGLLLWKLN